MPVFKHTFLLLSILLLLGSSHAFGSSIAQKAVAHLQSTKVQTRIKNAISKVEHGKSSIVRQICTNACRDQFGRDVLSNQLVKAEIQQQVLAHAPKKTATPRTAAVSTEAKSRKRKRRRSSANSSRKSSRSSSPDAKRQRGPKDVFVPRSYSQRGRRIRTADKNNARRAAMNKKGKKVTKTEPFTFGLSREQRRALRNVEAVLAEQPQPQW